MSSHQRDEPSSLAAVSASSSNSTSSAASTGGSPDATYTTLTTKVTTKPETMAATTTARGSTGTSSAVNAGVGVGTGIAVAGLILLLAAAVVFFRRRKRHHLDHAPPTPTAEKNSSVPLKPLPDPVPPTPTAETNSSVPLKPLPDPIPPTPTAETSSSVPLKPLSRPQITGLARIPYDCLLPGRSQTDIEEELPSLGRLINGHVRTHYHLDPVLVKPETLLASLCQLQLSEGTCRTVVRLSIDPNTRHVAIRHLLALVIFSNLDTHSVGSLSLLPPVLKELFKSRTQTHTEYQDPLVETALVGWNRLTAFLMDWDSDKETVLLSPSVESQVETLVALLQEFLVHFARTDDDGSHGVQQASLEHNVIRDCVKFGYMVFSDLCDWKFTFPQQERGVVVLPGLEKHSDDKAGELYNSPEMVLAPKVVMVDLMED